MNSELLFRHLRSRTALETPTFGAHEGSQQDRQRSGQLDLMRTRRAYRMR